MKKCKLLQLIMQRKILKTNFIAMDLYTCCHFRNRPGFCSYTFAKTCPFSCRAKWAFPSGETLTLPISRDSRYNSLYPSAVTAGITHYTLQAKSCAKGVPFGNPILSECVVTLPPKCKISGIDQPVPGTDLCRLFAYMGFLLYRPY